MLDCYSGVMNEVKSFVATLTDRNEALFLQTRYMGQQVFFARKTQLMNCLIQWRVANAIPAGPQIQVEKYTNLGRAQNAKQLAQNNRNWNKPAFADIEDELVGLREELLPVSEIPWLPSQRRLFLIYTRCVVH